LADRGGRSGLFLPRAHELDTLAEVHLNDKHGRSAGNIDIVLVSYDEQGRVLDFGSLEVQAVYISGNVRRPFEHYIQNPAAHHEMDWSNQPNYPRPDYLSSSRKRLVPQLIYKGGILKAWEKKQAVVLHRSFFETLPTLAEVKPDQADMVWMIYDLALDETLNRYQLVRDRLVFTQFKPVLDQISLSEPGPIETFIERLQEKLDTHLDGEQNPPDAPTLDQFM
jgi:hypothetical protein